MGWADNYIAKLQKGETVKFRPRGNSMRGRIESGQLVTVVPFEPKNLLNLNVRDIVLCKVNGKQFLHLVFGIRGDRDGLFAQIANAKGHVNGWTPFKNIYGKVVKIET